MANANADFVPSYGEDRPTQEASNLFRELFETDCDVYFVFNGTAANSLALASLCQSYHSVICHDSAHVETDECGAPEFFSNGTKLLTAGGPHGKLDLFEVERIVTARSDVHYPKPKVISLTQATESGTVYRVDEIRALAELAQRYRLHVHMDGARFANAVASAGASPKAMTWQAGVDVLCFGGTKNGMAVGEAVVYFNRKLSEEFEFRCKQAGQLASKMRFLAAPWAAMLRDGVWLRHARHANALARRLGGELQKIPGVRLLHPVEASGVFAELPDGYHEGLKDRGWRYYRFIGGGARLMCSWKTTETDIEALVGDLRAVAGQGSA
ncbi:MAG: low specificity L-threonine aldolase [Betaproteobacteria bacterium]|nr:low specificity L-threonine aldolase [Betaproteobacteria bacterium]